MDETGFLNVADVLSRGDTEAEWRSAVSCAYYAAFHKARRFLRQNGFAVPTADKAHAYLWLRLSNCGHPDIIELGHKLSHLRGTRNRADYDMDVSVDQAAAFDHVQVAADIVQLLDDLAQEPAIRDCVRDAIRVYERDVLREVTWRP